MIWSARPFYATAMLLASLPPLLATQWVRAPSAPAAVSNRMGLTLGEDDRHRVVVTSLRSGGSADRQGIKVGDQLTGIAGRPAVALEAVRQLVHAPGHCAMPLMFDRHGIPYRTIIWQCGRTGVG
ncbi:PDZ domain-containing protein [Sphingobium sp. CR2-8]|uniref:PDZ domain-containing protein n=1 Tax=Sphingobium sp. CR2-8 TaxID=1306534 RepID=UPI002DB6D370|nr:PDZ domain-containing protein [Sphingobium sp. CR2-8]MEC3912421.1 PDZ domain-containing protein [Sphingobium sp. CR2-8]